ncbi:uroporphyrinogen-III synthase [Psychrobacter sp. LFX-11D]|uniref:uroporphyrinogen-III synthase n=1 Tax=Psychrobacter sp. LFX-11D TaxID=458201 RepID=UPI00191ACCD7|nr:uroporphyrinogen-III synthase [Psychrobacter sp. LFX-11D]|tara:strand:+ start:30359 stop:31336 length:978 start_codon:yes stop_codon:yes gene_type:complete
MSWSSSKSTDSNQPINTPLLLPQIVINTRPVERAAPLTRHLQAAGMSVVDMPMLTLQPRLTTDSDMILMRQWLAGEYQALVIVSPTAAASGLAIWQLLEREHQANGATDKAVEAIEGSSNILVAPSHLIAVGEATAAVLNEAKLANASYQVLQPAIANNEGMLAMPEIDSLQAGDKLLVWRGLGGRRLLVDTLQARGVHIDSIAWYERKMPIDAMMQYQQWLQDFNNRNATVGITASQQAKPIVIVSSGTAFEHWESIVQAAKTFDVTEKNHVMSVNAPLKLSDFSYVVLGERLANMVAEQNLSYWRVEDLAPETILTAIKTTSL